MCVCVCTYVHVCAYLWRAEADIGYLPQLHTALFVEIGSLTKPDLTGSVRLVGQQVPERLLSLLISNEILSAYCTLDFT